MVASLEQRRTLLTSALGFMQLDRWNEPKPPVMTTLAGWLDSWTGLGAVVTGMAHSIVKGSAYEPTPWRAVQRAAWGR